MEGCITEGCDREHHARERCIRCYHRWQRATPSEQKEPRVTLWSSRLEEVRFMLDGGYNPGLQGMADALGMRRDAMLNMFRRSPEPDARILCSRLRERGAR